MSEHIVVLSLPGLREQDLKLMPAIHALFASGESVSLVPSFPAVSSVVQANLTTGKMPNEHGVTANRWFNLEQNQFLGWNQPEAPIQSPQFWETLKKHRPELTSALWFAPTCKPGTADYCCNLPAGLSAGSFANPRCDISPQPLEAEITEQLGHFPLASYLGATNLSAASWIIDAAAITIQKHRPNLVYLHLDYLVKVAQKHGPNSQEFQTAAQQLDQLLGKLFAQCTAALSHPWKPLYLLASELTVVDVDHVVFPNRILREAGLLTVAEIEGDLPEGNEQIDFAHSSAWALVDHQSSHIYLKDAVGKKKEALVQQICEIFARQPGIAQVLTEQDFEKYEIGHPMSGDIVLASAPNSWQSYYFWLDGQQPPRFARELNSASKPGYEPLELYYDAANETLPLDTKLLKGCMGAPAISAAQRGILMTSQVGVLEGLPIADTDVYGLILRQFGI